jgi:hypothetical protein
MFQSGWKVKLDLLFSKEFGADNFDLSFFVIKKLGKHSQVERLVS